MWPASVALSKILSTTGAGAVFGSWITPLVGIDDTLSIVAWTVASNALSQVTSDTAAAGVMVPISWSYAVASATGAQGIVAGYGANLRTMFVWGMIAALISVLLTILYFWFTIVVLGLDFYIMPPV